MRSLTAARTDGEDLSRTRRTARREPGHLNSFEMTFGKEVARIELRSETMPAKDERPELVPMIIATVVAVLSGVWLWSDLRTGALNTADSMITSAVVSRAGAMVIPSDPPAHLAAPQTVPAIRSTTGRVTP
jgi:hypothetical protein